ncbi:hypothetical protein PHYBLDRAFT_140939 [Phycomyces blakesleeanus NRRL 1555(-)]|uniref:Uncharacterized protein n=1 Tax=Phycomyces blakesleeanus (strain ATCC 8743b / DSM 1359 / FGSC 10004 / NBRC 33097 / NRRL 1555) TaxID=763407 RepID=A0A167Q139_PHYB8|nr:hypothetical protein PHYBLDRAFT_140939 [Phycomyces blakesleeanus NRRL 1555(-)]OAD78884.1 hypothetical protein PHYBLDRAFT_140939 [Phycomyces blakesleeanus NRRL 1555(-)]|eukprot:XP_018296924.1 hypothetical protein PHYBLDRAFT_140939 [Phycomyces blakesleeanus NRRL 1555(-)]
MAVTWQYDYSISSSRITLLIAMGTCPQPICYKHMDRLTHRSPAPIRPNHHGVTRHCIPHIHLLQQWIPLTLSHNGKSGNKMPTSFGFHLIKSVVVFDNTHSGLKHL